MKAPITEISFNAEGLKRLGYTKQQFIDEFSKIYPEADLNAYADNMGLISGPTVEKAAATFAPIPPAGPDEKVSDPIGGAAATGKEAKTKEKEGGK